MANPTVNMDSILDSVKYKIGRYALDDDNFDADLIMDINTVLMTLWQIGIGTKLFSITSSSETWDDFLGENYSPDKVNLEGIKTYTALRTRMLFDPPTSSSVSQVITDQIKELEWRLNAMVDPFMD